MQKIKIIIASLAILSLSFASLINTTDQVNRQNPGLGGNPAARAYNKTTGFEGGFTLMEKFAQSGSILADEQSSGLKASNVDPKDQMGDIFLSYTMGLGNMQYLNFEYDKSTNVIAARKYKLIVNTKATLEKNNVYGVERIGVTYSKDMNKTVKGLTVGAGIYQERSFETDYLKASKTTKDLGIAVKSEQDLVNEATYTSLAFGAIYDLGYKSKLTLAQNFSAAANWDKTGKDINNVKVDQQYNEEVLPDTTVGYIYKLNNKIELAGTMQMFWNKEYTMNDSNGGTTDVEMSKFGHNAFTLAGEYAYSNDLFFQGYYGWANEVGVFTTDTDGSNYGGCNLTSMGVNAVKIFGEHTIIAGLDRDMIFDDKAEPKTLTDETKFYLNYGYSF